MSSKRKRVKIKNTGIEIYVYRHVSGDWVNANDCTTIYKSDDLIFLT